MGKRLKIIIVTLLLLVGWYRAAFRYNRGVRLLSLVIYHNLIVSSTKFRIEGDRVYMNGYICRFTPKQLEKIIAENPQVRTIVMERVMGSLDDDSNFPMGEYVRKMKLNTYLTRDSEIASGGVDFFLSGNERFIEEGASLGVHSWQDVGEDSVEAKDIPKDDPRHRANADYIKDMLGSEDFYWFTIYAAEAGRIHTMTTDEILKYSIATTFTSGADL